MPFVQNLQLIDLFMRDGRCINYISEAEVKYLQACVKRSKKKRPLSKYNIFVKKQLAKLSDTDLKPRDKIKYVSELWRRDQSLVSDSVSESSASTTNKCDENSEDEREQILEAKLNQYCVEKNKEVASVEMQFKKYRHKDWTKRKHSKVYDMSDSDEEY